MKLTFRIWIWLIVLFLALISIFITPTFLQKGVLITSVGQNSTAFEQGLRQGDVIKSIDGEIVEGVSDYSSIIQEKFSSGEKIKITIAVSDSEYILYSDKAPDITVSEVPLTNIKTGLDLSGGARALVQAENHSLTLEEVNDLADVISNRFDVYGISDITVRPVSDLTGNNYLVEIAGATPEDLEDLVSQQGKFEAKIGNETVFTGGDKDIASVSRGGDSATISCPSNQNSDSYYCNFEFGVYLSGDAAERQARITDSLTVNSTSSGNYLSEPLDLYVDNSLLDSLLISESLKGRAETQISISGSAYGSTVEEAYDAAQTQMNKLQTILITGSLPFQLEIVKLDTISPTLGNSFTKYILLAGLIALIIVSIIVFIRYRVKSSIAPIIICTSEIIITLGIAALIQWDLDLASIAGILAAIGTGVDDQIVLLDEARQKEQINLKQKMKRAFAIILGAYFTSVASLFPLWWAGAGLLKGFVFTTIIGISVGVLIARPAFADIVKIVEKE